MKERDPLIYGIIGALIGGAIVWFLASTAVNGSYYGMMQMMGMRYSSNSQTGKGMMGDIDQTFIEQMIPHHEDAITMGKLAQTKAEHQEIKKLADNIISSQGKEINQMKEWYKNWYGTDVPQDEQVMGMHGMMKEDSTTHMGMMGNESDGQSLENATNFDKNFIEEMIPHHQMAVMMANMLLRSTTRPEMQELAKNIIAAQTKEIQEMRQWYKDWGYKQ